MVVAKGDRYCVVIGKKRHGCFERWNSILKDDILFRIHFLSWEYSHTAHPRTQALTHRAPTV